MKYDQNSDGNDGPNSDNQANRDAGSTALTNTDEAIASHKPGAYPAKTEQNYRYGPIDKIAVHYVRLNRMVERKTKRNKQHEDNVRSTELDFMLDLQILFKETAIDPDLIELNCCIEENNTSQKTYPLMGHHNFRRSDNSAKTTTLCSPQCLSPRTPWNLKICSEAALFWWPNMRTDIEKNSKHAQHSSTAVKI